MVQAFWLALQFLTRLPTPPLGTLEPAAQGRMVLMFPLVGLIIGLLLAVAQGVLGVDSPLLVASLLLIGWVLISGGLHLDGLADSADAWLGGHGDRDNTLRIMKDPASGPAGVSALVLVLLVKFAALAAAPSWQVLLLAPILGRTAVLALLLTTPYARPAGLGSVMSETLPRRAAYGVLLAIGLLTLLLLGGAGLGLLLLLLVAGLLLRRLMLRRLGGTTGDTAGATVEIVEALVLVYLVL